MAPLGLGLQPEGDQEALILSATDESAAPSEDKVPDTEQPTAKKSKGSRGGKGSKSKGSGGSGKGKGGKAGSKGGDRGNQGKGERSVRATKRLEAHQHQMSTVDWKKCLGQGGCSKWLATTDFYAGQSKCKECNAMNRHFQRCCDVQDCRQEVDGLSQADEEQHGAMMRAFAKERTRANTVGEKCKFNVKTWQIEWRSREGTRREDEGEMMWEAEYYEWAATAKAGFLSKQEKNHNGHRGRHNCRGTHMTNSAQGAT